MWRLRGFIFGLAGALSVASVSAGDIPAPLKKPRDRNGAVITTPTQAIPNKAEAPIQTQAPATTSKLPSAAPGKPDKTEGRPGAAAPPAKAASKAGKHTQPAAGEKTTPTPLPDKPAPATAEKTPVAPPIPKEWSAQDVELAKARCNAVLKGIDAVTVPEPPFRDGECGAPAAVRLISIGKNPQVSLDPPALLTCDMVVGLHTWMKQDVQPLAKKHLGSEIIKIETMSDYACRNAYGRTGGKLSEHGHANALDIRGFVTAKAQTAYVLEQWGPVQRDIIAARVAAEKAAAEKTAAAAAQAAGSAANPAKNEAATKSGVAPATKGTLAEGLPDVMRARNNRQQPSLGFEPAHLGGPKDKSKTSRSADRASDIPVQAGAAAGPTSIFLHAAHDAACQLFGTTLGPEANDAHRNHFHVDMAPRKTTKICD